MKTLKLPKLSNRFRAAVLAAPLVLLAACQSPEFAGAAIGGGLAACGGGLLTNNATLAITGCTIAAAGIGGLAAGGIARQNNYGAGSQLQPPIGVTPGFQHGGYGHNLYGQSERDFYAQPRGFRRQFNNQGHHFPQERVTYGHVDPRAARRAGCHEIGRNQYGGPAWQCPDYVDIRRLAR